MNILFHTIAIEPERWTPKRVSRPLIEILGPVAEAGFRELEIYEPHLGAEATSSAIREALQANGQRPVILSSYLNLNPAITSDAEAEEGIEQIARRVDFYGFGKVRLFAGGKLQPDDRAGIAGFVGRVQRVADRVPGAAVLLETHDGSLADDPRAVVDAVEAIDRPNVALLFQPTFFTDHDAIIEQFRLQLPHIRHLHLQNRNPDLSFARMDAGIVPWPEIFAMGGATCDATLEFVPAGICPARDFDLPATLQQAVEEVQAIRSVLSRSSP
jgi:sugar phosphate isomerase/epimerase